MMISLHKIIVVGLLISHIIIAGQGSAGQNSYKSIQRQEALQMRAPWLPDQDLLMH